MAELTPLDEKLGEVLGLAQAARQGGGLDGTAINRWRNRLGARLTRRARRPGQVRSALALPIGHHLVQLCFALRALGRLANSAGGYGGGRRRCSNLGRRGHQPDRLRGVAHGVTRTLARGRDRVLHAQRQDRVVGRNEEHPSAHHDHGDRD